MLKVLICKYDVEIDLSLGFFFWFIRSTLRLIHTELK